ncbi:MAG: response regulator [Solirubrobacteraceae bacterium]
MRGSTRPNSIRVVVCDDAPELRELFRVELEADGDIEVLALAADGKEAVALVTRFRPDVILLDLSMPGQDGLEVVRDVRAASATTTVLVVTGSVDDGLRARALEHGALRCLSKRTSAGELRTAVREAANARA